MLKSYFCIFFILGTLFASKAQAQTEAREFVMSCTYGVMAGTLVGAALLAFTDQPGENLSRVARGASLGLYTGIALGLYVIYGVPSESEDPTATNGPSANWKRKSDSHAPMALLPKVEGLRSQITGVEILAPVFTF